MSESGPEARPLVMADVARAAGVSKQTVSRVMNNSPYVRKETRDRVLAAVRELGYQLNSTARALATGQTYTFGVIVFDAVHYGPAMVLNSIGQAARESGYVVSVAPLRSPDRASLTEAADRLLRHEVDGMIAIAPERDMSQALLDVPRKLPMVVLDGAPDPTIPVVAADEEGGARRATEHLLELGHRTVHHIAGPRQSLASAGRLIGWRAALEVYGAPALQPLYGDWGARSGYEAGLLLAEDPKVTAILAGNDPMAFGVLRALHDRGRRVPDDVSVIGFDDIPEAAYAIPPLSTIRPDFAEMGRRCISLLLGHIQSGEPPATLRSVVPSKLVVRQSSGGVPHG